MNLDDFRTQFIFFCNRLLDDDEGINEEAYDALLTLAGELFDVQWATRELVNKVNATDGRFYLHAVYRDGERLSGTHILAP